MTLMTIQMTASTRENQIFAVIATMMQMTARTAVNKPAIR